MFTEDHRFFNYLDSTTNSLKGDVEKFLISLDSVSNPIYKNAILAWEESVAGDSLQYIPFSAEGEKYWGAFRPAARGEKQLWIAFVASEDNFSNVLQGKFRVLFIASLLVLVLSVIVMFYVLLKSKTKEKAFSLITHDDILSMISGGEDDFTEFKSTIRMNLHSKKPGKEIEVAWLKSVVAFCNTKGGNILIGVNDDGEILGLDADLFQNEDKCLLHVQNLLKDHVGMEFTKYINYKLYDFKPQKVLIVNCVPASEPLFLRANNKEQYYVRSGPSSIELPLSKAIKYIEDRKAD